ncbi:TPA: bacteriophage antitermination protein Q [Raoultella planticola]
MSIYQRINGADWRNVWVVGDLHGCYTLLMSELDKVNFDPAQDLLISVGDLVDRGAEIALVLPVEYSTASWRRALLSLEEHQKAWLLWNYSDNIRWEHQETITRWAWEQFSEKLAGIRIAKKTVDRLRQLIWLAAQDVKAELAGRETYEYQSLAELVGVAKSTWTETYLPHWLALRSSFEKLDSDALISVTRSRSQQKATNLDVSLAKPN